MKILYYQKICGQGLKKLLKKEYQTTRWLEKARSTYITSARYKFEWFWNLYKKVVTGYYTSKHEVYIPFAEDIFAAISDGARTWADYRKNKGQMNEMDLQKVQLYSNI